MFPNGCGCFNVFHGCCLHLHHGNLTFPTCRLANSIGNCCVSLMISDSWMFLEDGQITVWYSSRLERKRDIPGVFSRFFLQTRNSECSAPRLPFAHMPILCPSTGLMSREELRAAATTWLLTPINKKKNHGTWIPYVFQCWDLTLGCWNIQVLSLLGKLGDEPKCCHFPLRSKTGKKQLFLGLNPTQENEPLGDTQTSMINVHHFRHGWTHNAYIT
jgi:hypothetical protein